MIGVTVAAFASLAAGVEATTRGPVGAVWISTLAVASASASVAVAWPLSPETGSAPVTTRSPGLARVKNVPVWLVRLSQGSAETRTRAPGSAAPPVCRTAPLISASASAIRTMTYCPEPAIPGSLGPLAGSALVTVPCASLRNRSTGCNPDSVPLPTQRANTNCESGANF